MTGGPIWVISTTCPLEDDMNVALGKPEMCIPGR